MLLTVIVIVVLLIALAITFRRAIAFPPEGAVDRLLIDGQVGLHVGWVTVATVVDIAAWLTAVGPDSWASAATVWGVIVLVVAAALATPHPPLGTPHRFDGQTSRVSAGATRRK